MSNFMRRHKGWSDISDSLILSDDSIIDSDDSTETKCTFQVRNMVAKAKSIKDSSQHKERQFLNKDQSPDESSVLAKKPCNASFDFAIPNFPKIRTPSLPKARDCLNPSDSDASIVMVRKPQTMYRPKHISGVVTGNTSKPAREAVQRMNMIPARDEMFERIDELPHRGMVGRIDNSNFLSKNREELMFNKHRPLNTSSLVTGTAGAATREEILRNMIPARKEMFQKMNELPHREMLEWMSDPKFSSRTREEITYNEHRPMNTSGFVTRNAGVATEEDASRNMTMYRPKNISGVVDENTSKPAREVVQRMNMIPAREEMFQRRDELPHGEMVERMSNPNFSSTNREDSIYYDEHRPMNTSGLISGNAGTHIREAIPKYMMPARDVSFQRMNELPHREMVERIREESIYDEHRVINTSGLVTGSAGTQTREAIPKYIMPARDTSFRSMDELPHRQIVERFDNSNFSGENSVETFYNEHRSTNTSGLVIGNVGAPRRDMIPRNMIPARKGTFQRVDELPHRDRIINSNSSSNNTEKNILCNQSFASSDSLRREVQRRQMAGPIMHKISPEKVSHYDLSKLIHEVKTNTKPLSPQSNQILLQVLEISKKKIFNENNLSTRSSDISSGNDHNYSRHSRKKLFKRRTKKKSLHYNDAYYKQSPQQVEDDMSTVHSYSVRNEINNLNLASGTVTREPTNQNYGHTIHSLPNGAYRSCEDTSTFNTSKLPTHQPNQKVQQINHTGRNSMMSEYSNLSMQPSFLKRKLFSQSSLLSESTAVNRSDSPMRPVTIHNVYKASDDVHPRKRKRTTLYRPSIAQRNMSYNRSNESWRVNPSSLTPLLRKLAFQDRGPDPVIIDECGINDLHRDSIPWDNRQGNVTTHLLSKKSNNHLSKSRKLFTSGPDSETEDDASRQDKLQMIQTTKTNPKTTNKVQNDPQLRKCYVSIQRIPTQMLRGYLLQSERSKELLGLSKYESKVNFKVPKKTLSSKPRKNKIASSTEVVNNSVDTRLEENSNIILATNRESIVNENLPETTESKSLDVISLDSKSRNNTLKCKAQNRRAKKTSNTIIDKSDSQSNTKDINTDEGKSNEIVPPPALSPPRVEPSLNVFKKPSTTKMLVKSVPKTNSTPQSDSEHGTESIQKIVTCSQVESETSTAETNSQPMKTGESNTNMQISGNHSTEPPPKQEQHENKPEIPTVRRSGRNRVPPLNYWRNESALYRQERLYSWQKNYSDSSQSYPIISLDPDNLPNSSSSSTIKSDKENVHEKVEDDKPENVKKTKKSKPKKVTEPKNKTKIVKKKSVEDKDIVTKKSAGRGKKNKPDEEIVQSVNSQCTNIENKSKKQKSGNPSASRNETLQSKTQNTKSSFSCDGNISEIKKQTIGTKTHIVSIDEEKCVEQTIPVIESKEQIKSFCKSTSHSKILKKKTNILNNIANTMPSKNEQSDKEKVNMSNNLDVRKVVAPLANRAHSMKTKDKDRLKNVTSVVREHSGANPKDKRQNIVPSPIKRYDTLINSFSGISDDEECWSVVSFCSSTRSKRSKFIHF